MSGSYFATDPMPSPWVHPELELCKRSSEGLDSTVAETPAAFEALEAGGHVMKILVDCTDKTEAAAV
ncbi:MAG: hypothetical protein HOY75_31160 [Streptomyces sp.]|nr:hypothetical protein [Streptomyces sp.]